MSPRISIREAERRDVELIFGWIVELAVYERAPDQVTGTAAMLRDALFGPNASAEAVIAEIDGEPVGFAVYHGTFSTWECRPGLWLEDLYVPVERRRAGVGAALLSHLAGVTLARGCARLEWAALDWNTPALQFYDKLGATRMHEWRVHRLDGSALERVARALDPA